MMNIRSFLIVIISFLGGVASFAQANLLNAKTPKQIGIKSAAQLISDNDKPIAYGYVDDRDIMMGKTVWEIIDLSERINFPLYFPKDTVNIGSDRRSLFNVLIKAIKDEKITEVYDDSYFNTKKSYKDIKASLKHTSLSDVGRTKMNDLGLTDKYKDINPEQISSEDAQNLIKDGIDEQYILTNEITGAEISKYKIKGYWYFDSRQSELKYRLLGICPIANDVYSNINDKDAADVDLFWVFFPDARNVLHSSKSFNDKNSSMPISFDQILNSRRFNSVIYQEENVYGDRTIVSYMKDNAQNQLLESERVKEKVRNFEENMWNY